MKKIIFLLLAFSPICILSASLDSIIIGKEKLYQHHVLRPQNDNLVIFLHGSVSQFKKKKNSDVVPLENLIEQNSTFISTFTDFGLNIVFPIAFNQHNWLEESGDEYLDKVIEKYAKKHKNIYICGFSDGGTGAYRYFHKFHDKLSGLVMFNGFPQYENQHLQTDYKK
jgi:predicted peptidase